MLALRDRLKAAGEWTGTSNETRATQRAYERIALIRFDGLCLQGGANFSSFVFPGEASFDQVVFGDAKFSKGDISFDEALFCDARTSFSGARFNSGDAWFDGARFEEGNTCFDDAEFAGGRAMFGEVRFGGGTTSFANARFSGGSASFLAAEFNGSISSFADAQFTGGDASFFGAQFAGGDAWFDGAQFVRNLSMDKVSFSGVAEFFQAGFSGPVSFNDAVFQGATSFRSARSGLGFNFTHATFAQVPNFIQTTFHQPPRLDNIAIADPVQRVDTWDDDPRPSSRWRVAKDPDAEAKYRVLRKMAIDAHDHERELEFHAQEIRCRRFWRDKPALGAPGSGKFWFGWAYGGVSDFGRSLARPATIWAGLILVCAMAFLALSGPGGPAARHAAFAQIPAPLYECPPGARYCPVIEGALRRVSKVVAPVLNAPYRAVIEAECVSGSGSFPAGEAMALSLKNAFVFINWDRAEAARRTYGCLYGFETSNGSAVKHPKVPLGVSLLSLLQSTLSLILIFLFALGLRNMLKLK